MFTDAIKYLDNYRKRRIKSFKNEERQRWFTDDVDSISALFKDKFGSDEESAKLSSFYSQKTIDLLKLQGAELKLNLLTGFRHDLRGQFAIGSEHTPRTALDFDRHAASEAKGAQRRLEVLEQATKIKEAGANQV